MFLGRYECLAPPSAFAGWLADLWKEVSLKMNQQFPLQRIRLRNPKICRRETQMSKTSAGIDVRKRPRHTCLTTDAFKRPMRGMAPGVHLLLISLQTARKVTMVAGLVAVFTSDRPFAQAEDDVSHRKAKAEVSRRS